MKKSFLLFAAIAMSVSFSTAVMAQTSATVAATPAGARLIVPMAITQDHSLHFGTINLLGNSTAGTVVLSAVDAGRSYTGGGIIGSSIAPVAANAAYHVTGTYNATYALTLPSTAITVTETIGSTTMTITNFKANFNTATEASSSNTSTLSASGADYFTVGGTLNVASGQQGGIYAGTFPVIVDYN